MNTLRTKRRVTDAVVSMIAILIGLIICFPVIYCILGAFKTPAEFVSPKLLPDSFAYLENFKDALSKAPFCRYMANSFIVALSGTVIRLIFSVCAAFVFTHYDFKGKNFCFYLILGTMMIPGDTLLIANYKTISELDLLNTYLGIIIVSFVSASQMFMLRQRFLSIPKELRWAAQMDGCGELLYIQNVLIPICKPILTTLFVQSFITLWNAYLWPLIVTASSSEMRTIMVGITKLNSWEDSNYELVLAGVTISLIPSFILFMVMRHNMNKGGTDGALVG